MADTHKTYYPAEIESFTEGGDAYEALKAGREVTINSKGLILDVYDPRTKKIYDNLGNEIGTRETVFVEPRTDGVQITSRETFTPAAKGQFPEGSDAWEALNAGRNVTVDAKGNVVEVRDPVTGKLYDVSGNEIGVAAEVYPESYKKKVTSYKSVSYRPEDKGQFLEGSDAWEALNAGREVTIGSDGSILDIWDRESGDTYDVLGQVIGKRTDPYPSQSNIDLITNQITEINAQIAALRAARSALKGAARAALTARISALCSQRGALLWRKGRMMRRARLANESYQKRITD